MFDEQQILRKKLITILDEKKKVSASYSLRNMAKDLQLSPGYLSDFLQGKKLVSPHCMEKMVSTFCVDLNERKELLEKLQFEVIEATDLNGNRIISTRYSILINTLTAPFDLD